MKRLLALGIVLILPVVAAAQSQIDFNRDVRPLLSDRCFQCHGPDEHDRQADLRLDRADGDDGAYQVIEPGAPEDSELWLRVTSQDDDVMPPPDANKPPLDKAEQEILRQWIEQGAAYADVWAFVPPTMPELPPVDTDAWSDQPIDRLVKRRLDEEGLAPQPPADKRTLIRRLSLDLTGLPPTREEIDEFLADDSKEAYQRLVDRLLAKPQFGEHVARYWLDLVRFADTNGIHHDHYREMSPYRDWVIRAFNENLPYDDFVKYQLAGDLYPEPTQDQLVASGFNRLHLIIDVGTALPEESYTRNVIDRVTAVGTAFMGLTVQCAVCHDHKYDPVTMKDFYQLFAFFNNLDAEPETGGRRGFDFQHGLQQPYISLATDEQQAQLDAWSAEIQELEAAKQATQAELDQLSEDADRRSLETRLAETQQQLDQLQQQKQALEDSIAYAMVMKERDDVRPAYLLKRGQYDQLGDEVPRGTPGFLPPLPATDGLPTRMDLAQWFVSPDNPLTARVAVNRFWQQLFGVGIVKTSDDFGAQGEWPSHPQLLDYLTVTFQQSGWDVKALFKEMVLSQAYRQSSHVSPEAYQRDPENRLFAHGARFRLDAEVLRDQILATSGLLSTQLYGRSVKPPQPEGLWKSVSMPSSFPSDYQADTGDKIYRRSVYTFWKRGMPPPQMTIFNAPMRDACIARRERTNTPLQALLLLNEQQYLLAARNLAITSLTDEPNLKAEQRLEQMYETITTQLPDADESAELLRLLTDLKETYSKHPELTERLCQDVELPESLSSAELAAWSLLVSTLYNLDITKTRS